MVNSFVCVLLLLLYSSSNICYIKGKKPKLWTVFCLGSFRIFLFSFLFYISFPNKNSKHKKYKVAYTPFIISFLFFPVTSGC